MEATSPASPIVGHGLDIVWIHNLNNKDISGAFGVVEGGITNVARGRFESKLSGLNSIEVSNPNPFAVTVLLRSGKKGLDCEVPTNGTLSVSVPDGNYNIFFVYSDRPNDLYQGQSFALNKYGFKIRLTNVRDGNYAIRKVR